MRQRSTQKQNKISITIGWPLSYRLPLSPCLACYSPIVTLTFTLAFANTCLHSPSAKTNHKIATMSRDWLQLVFVSIMRKMSSLQIRNLVKLLSITEPSWSSELSSHITKHKESSPTAWTGLYNHVSFISISGHQSGAIGASLRH